MQQQLTRMPSNLGRPSVNLCLQRRRRLLAGLVIVSVVAFLLALVTSSGAMWALHLIADVLLAVYVGVLLHIRNTAATVEMTY